MIDINNNKSIIKDNKELNEVNIDHTSEISNLFEEIIKDILNNSLDYSKFKLVNFQYFHPFFSLKLNERMVLNKILVDYDRDLLISSIYVNLPLTYIDFEIFCFNINDELSSLISCSKLPEIHFTTNVKQSKSKSLELLFEGFNNKNNTEVKLLFCAKIIDFKRDIHALILSRIFDEYGNMLFQYITKFKSPKQQNLVNLNKTSLLKNKEYYNHIKDNIKTKF